MLRYALTDSGLLLDGEELKTYSPAKRHFFSVLIRKKGSRLSLF